MVQWGRGVYYILGSAFSCATSARVASIVLTNSFVCISWASFSSCNSRSHAALCASRVSWNSRRKFVMMSATSTLAFASGTVTLGVSLRPAGCAMTIDMLGGYSVIELTSY